MALVQIPTPVVSANKTLAQIASGSITSGTLLSLTSLTSYDTLKLRIESITSGSNYSLTAKINNNANAIYDYNYVANTTNETDFSEFNRNNFSTGNSEIPMNTPDILSNNTSNSLQIDFYNCKETGFTTYQWIGLSRAFYSALYNSTIQGTGIFKSASAVSSIQLSITSAFTAGNYVLWGG
jgi:hypothetical protein